MIQNRNTTSRQQIKMENIGDKCHACSSGSAVCMHVWNKFDLLPPTPPRSPEHDLQSLGLEDFDLYDTEFFLREEDVLATMKTLFPEEPPDALHADPMWSGNSSAKKTTEKASNSDYSDSIVSPKEVFPYPMTDTYLTETKVMPLLGTETPSDSEEEEIDVVTVQSKDQRTKKTNEDFDPAEIRRTTTTVPVRIAGDDKRHSRNSIKITIKEPHRPADEHHNYCMVSTSSNKRGRSSPIDSPVPTKRHKNHQVSGPELRRALTQVSPRVRGGGHVSASSSQNSSDSEEYCGEGKRNQHNVLERKRRNDLKFSFFNLRDIVPDLCKQERAPKVLILKKSADYVHRLHAEEKQLVLEKDRETRRRDQLTRTLSRLQNSSY